MKLLAHLETSEFENEPSDLTAESIKKSANASYMIEMELFFASLTLIWVIEKHLTRHQGDGNNMEDHPDNLASEIIEFAEYLVMKAEKIQSAAANVLKTKIYFYYSRVHELLGRMTTIRPRLLNLLRTSIYYKTSETSATLINLLLRNYISSGLFEDADKFIHNTEFPAQAPYNEWARYHFYVGSVFAIRLDYTNALFHLDEARKKAPQESAIGFLQTASKWYVVVQLLVGIIPSRKLFRNNAFKAYFMISKSIYAGNVVAFEENITAFADKLKSDKLYNLVIRLRHTVMKSGIKKIFVSYDRISLSDVAQKLYLDSELDAEYVLIKAIRDGLVMGCIDHGNKILTTSKHHDVLKTCQPMQQFDTRTMYFLNLAADAQLRMRYPTAEKIKKGPIELSYHIPEARPIA